MAQGPEWLRRALLGMVTTLIVARPLVFAEDPGKLLWSSSPADLSLTLLWFVLAVGVAAWWAWARPGTWHGGLVEIGLAGFVALTFFSASEAAYYKHPAWLIAWESAAVLVAMVIVRNLARTSDDNRHLLTAILATGAMLAAFALYQQFFDIPRQRAEYEANPAGFVQVRSKTSMLLRPDMNQLMPERLAALALAPAADLPFPGGVPWAAVGLYRLDPEPVPDPLVQAQIRLLEEGRPYGSFGSPATFAIYLALVLPVLAGAVIACWLHWRAALPTLLTAGTAVLVAAAMVLTQSWSAVAAMGAVGLGVLAALVCRRLEVPPFWVLGLVAVVGLLAVVNGWGPAEGSGLPRWLGVPAEAWPTTRTLMDSQESQRSREKQVAVLGVGPGNFGRHYRHYLPTPAAAPLDGPQNFALEVAACCGLLALGLLLGSVFAFFKRVATDEPLPDRENGPSIRWEFYLGGVAGLILAFALRANQVPRSEILWEGAVAGGRSLIWFGVFALLEGVPWTGRIRSGAIAAGVGGMLLALSASGSIFYPSLAQALWILIAIGLNSLEPRPHFYPRRFWLSHLAPLPVLVALLATYVLLVFYPITSAATRLQTLRRFYPTWRDRVEPAYRHQMANEVFPESRLKVTERAEAVLKRGLLQPGLEIVRTDPGNSYFRAVMANLFGQQWQLAPGERGKIMQSSGSEQERGWADVAISYAVDARTRDQYGTDGWFAEYLLRLQFADRVPDPAQKEEQLRLASLVLARLVDDDPQSPRLRFLLADLLYRMGRTADAREQAQRARDMDRQAVDPARQLTAAQRDQLNLRLGRR